MNIDRLQDAMVTEAKKLLESLRTCQKHAGRISIEELAALSVTSPALLIAFLGTDKVEESGTEEMIVPCRFAAYVVTQDAKELPRDTAAKNIVEALLAWIPNQRFKASDLNPPVSCSTPEQVAATNLYDGAVRGKAVALWAVSWLQRVTIGTSIFAENGTLPDKVYIGGELQEAL
jgi:phage gp37-like protein